MGITIAGLGKSKKQETNGSDKKMRTTLPSQLDGHDIRLCLVVSFEKPCQNCRLLSPFVGFCSPASERSGNIFPVHALESRAITKSKKNNRLCLVMFGYLSGNIFPVHTHLEQNGTVSFQNGTTHRSTTYEKASLKFLTT